MDRSLISYQILKDFPQVKAFTTLKQTLVGEESPRFTGNPEIQALKNRKKLAEILNMEAEQLIFPRQTHTSSVACVNEMPGKIFNNTDALVTNRPGICLCIQTADCVPVLLYDPVRKAIGAVHAGWRGTVGLIAGKVVKTLQHNYASNPKNVKVVIGPSIGPENYEVGSEVVEAVRKSIPQPESSLKKHASGKYHLDLWEANRQVLLESGILSKNIEISGNCTYSGENHFFSARREGIETGRLVSGIMLLSP